MFPCPIMVYYSTRANRDAHSVRHNVQQGSVPSLLSVSVKSQTK